MLDEKHRTLHAHPSPSIKLRASLLPLRIALTAAEKESPARPLRVDSNERLAVQLIARMQARYKKTHPFVIRQDDSHEVFEEMAGSHAR